MKKLQALILFLSGFLLLVFVSNASALMIDTFSVYQEVSTTSADPKVGSEKPDSDPATSILGGYRDMGIEKLSGSTYVQMFAVVDPSEDVLNVSLPSGVSGDVTLTWDGQDNDPWATDYDGLYTGDPGSEIGVDLTENDKNEGFLFKTTSLDLSGLVIKFYVYKDASTYAEKILNVDSPGSPFLAFNTFSMMGGMVLDDFKNVGAIKMVLEGPEDFDARFDFIEATVETPEPATFMLFGIGILGFAGILRRKSSK